MGPEAEVLAVSDNGLIDLDDLEAKLAAGPALVAIQLVNNETGVIQPIAQIQARVRAAGSLLLADCAQGAGKIALPDADFIAISGHKFGGPPGLAHCSSRTSPTSKPAAGRSGAIGAEPRICRLPRQWPLRWKAGPLPMRCRGWRCCAAVSKRKSPPRAAW